MLLYKETKPRLMTWILLMQEFDIEIKDGHGVENVVLIFPHLVPTLFGMSTFWNLKSNIFMVCTYS